MPSTPRGSVGPIFHMRWTFSVTVWLSWIFARLNWSQDFVLFRGIHEDFGGSSSWSILNQLSCILNFSHFSLRLDCSSVWWCIQAHFLPDSQEDGVVQLPFRPALRLRLFSNGLLAPSFLSNLSSSYFPSAFRWNLRPLDSLILPTHSSWKSVRIPVDGLFRNQNMKIEKLFGIWAILAQDWL